MARLLVSWAAPVVALHLVSGADQSFSTWNHCFKSSRPGTQQAATCMEIGGPTVGPPAGFRREDLIGWTFGLVFGVASALASSVGFLMRHRGAVKAPDVDVRRPVRTVRELFREKWWAIGFGVAFFAWLLHVVALKLAPLSLVQATLASSFVFLGVVAERWFGLPVGRRQWIGIGLTSAGLALLGLTAHAAEPSGAQSAYGTAPAAAFEAALVAAGVGLLLWPRMRAGSGKAPSAILLGASAGLLYTVSHIGIKALTHGFFAPAGFAWPPLILAAFVGAFFASARSLQLGDAVSVIAVTAATSNMSAIVGGILVFNDPVGANALVVAVRMTAFALVVIAASLIPAPIRAAEDSEAPAPAGEPWAGAQPERVTA